MDDLQGLLSPTAGGTDQGRMEPFLGSCSSMAAGALHGVGVNAAFPAFAAGQPTLPPPPAVTGSVPGLQFNTSTAAPATGRGEFAAGFLWFDAFDVQTNSSLYASGAVGAAPVPTNVPTVPFQPLQLPLAHVEVRQVAEPFHLPAAAVTTTAATGTAAPLSMGGLPQAALPQPVVSPHDQLQLVPCREQQQQQQQQQQQAHQQAQVAAEPVAAAAVGRDGRKGRGSRSGASEEERRARNRATQARFRERQKAKNEQLLAEHAATEAELDRARSQLADLQVQNSVLQKMLTMRDGALVVLGGAPPLNGDRQIQQQQQKQQQLAAPPTQLEQQLSEAMAVDGFGAAAMAVAGTSASPLSRKDRSGSGLSSAVQQQMEWLGHELTAHLAMLELPVNAHPDEAMAVAHAKLAPLLDQAPMPLLRQDEQLRELTEQLVEQQSLGGATSSQAAASYTSEASSPSRTASSLHDGSSGAAGAHNGAVQRQQGAAPIGLAALMRERPDLVQRVSGMTPEDMVADWVDKARTIKELLENHEISHKNEELEQILDIFRSWGGTLSLTLHLKPDNAQALFATAADAAPGTWEAVAAALQPTRAQGSMLQQLWHAYAGRAQALRAERAAAVAAVQHAAQHVASGAVTLDTLPASTLGGLMSRYLALFDAAGKLSTLQDAEFVAMLQLIGRVGAVFSPVQKARAVATCYPCFPDTVQILRALCESSVSKPSPQQVAMAPHGM